jgi:hypothetical protein
MKKFYVISAAKGKRYELFAMENDAGVLVIDEISEFMPGLLGNLDLFKSKKRQKLRELAEYKKDGVSCYVEERRSEFGKEALTLDLNTSIDGRLARDVYFEDFISLLATGRVILPKDKKGIAPNSKSYETKVSDSGKITYLHRKGDIDGEFRAVLLLIYAHVNPPKGVGYFIQVEKAIINQDPHVDRITRKRKAVTTGYDKVLRKGIRAEIEAQQEINRQKAKLRKANNGQ